MHEDALGKAQRYRRAAYKDGELAKQAEPGHLAEVYREIAVRYMFMAELTSPLRPVPSASSLLWNDVGGAAGSAGRWDEWHNTAPGLGCRNAGIDFDGWTNHTLGPRQLIAQIAMIKSVQMMSDRTPRATDGFAPPPAQESAVLSVYRGLVPMSPKTTPSAKAATLREELRLTSIASVCSQKGQCHAGGWEGNLLRCAMFRSVLTGQ
jgi:hypothetical protein